MVRNSVQPLSQAHQRYSVTIQCPVPADKRYQQALSRAFDSTMCMRPFDTLLYTVLCAVRRYVWAARALGTSQGSRLQNGHVDL